MTSRIPFSLVWTYSDCLASYRIMDFLSLKTMYINPDEIELGGWYLCKCGKPFKEYLITDLHEPMLVQVQKQIKLNMNLGKKFLEMIESNNKQHKRLLELEDKVKKEMAEK